jgi:hypothetical protein
MRADFYIIPTRTASKIQLNFIGAQTGATFTELAADINLNN